jgi:hypothetical protein
MLHRIIQFIEFPGSFSETDLLPLALPGLRAGTPVLLAHGAAQKCYALGKTVTSSPVFNTCWWTNKP